MGSFFNSKTSGNYQQTQNKLKGFTLEYNKLTPYTFSTKNTSNNSLLDSPTLSDFFDSYYKTNGKPNIPDFFGHIADDNNLKELIKVSDYEDTSLDIVRTELEREYKERTHPTNIPLATYEEKDVSNKVTDVAEWENGNPAKGTATYMTKPNKTIWSMGELAKLLEHSAKNEKIISLVAYRYPFGYTNLSTGIIAKSNQRIELIPIDYDKEVIPTEMAIATAKKLGWETIITSSSNISKQTKWHMYVRLETPYIVTTNEHLNTNMWKELTSEIWRQFSEAFDEIKDVMYDDLPMTQKIFTYSATENDREKYPNYYTYINKGGKGVSISKEFENVLNGLLSGVLTRVKNKDTEEVEIIEATNVGKSKGTSSRNNPLSGNRFMFPTSAFRELQKLYTPEKHRDTLITIRDFMEVHNRPEMKLTVMKALAVAFKLNQGEVVYGKGRNEIALHIKLLLQGFIAYKNEEITEEEVTDRVVHLVDLAVPDIVMRNHIKGHKNLADMDSEETRVAVKKTMIKKEIVLTQDKSVKNMDSNAKYLQRKQPKKGREAVLRELQELEQIIANDSDMSKFLNVTEDKKIAVKLDGGYIPKKSMIKLFGYLKKSPHIKSVLFVSPTGTGKTSLLHDIFELEQNAQIVAYRKTVKEDSAQELARRTDPNADLTNLPSKIVENFDHVKPTVEIHRTTDFIMGDETHLAISDTNFRLDQVNNFDDEINNAKKRFKDGVGLHVDVTATPYKLSPYTYDLEIIVKRKEKLPVNIKRYSYDTAENPKANVIAHKMVEVIKDGKLPLFFANNIALLQSIADMITRNGYKGEFITSDYKGDFKLKDFGGGTSSAQTGINWHDDREVVIFYDSESVGNFSTIPFAQSLNRVRKKAFEVIMFMSENTLEHDGVGSLSAFFKTTNEKCENFEKSHLNHNRYPLYSKKDHKGNVIPDSKSIITEFARQTEAYIFDNDELFKDRMVEFGLEVVSDEYLGDYTESLSPLEITNDDVIDGVKQVLEQDLERYEKSGTETYTLEKIAKEVFDPETKYDLKYRGEKSFPTYDDKVRKIYQDFHNLGQVTPETFFTPEAFETINVKKTVEFIRTANLQEYRTAHSYHQHLKGGMKKGTLEKFSDIEFAEKLRDVILATDVGTVSHTIDGKEYKLFLGGGERKKRAEALLDDIPEFEEELKRNIHMSFHDENETYTRKTGVDILKDIEKQIFFHSKQFKVDGKNKRGYIASPDNLLHNIVKFRRPDISRHFDGLFSNKKGTTKMDKGVSKVKPKKKIIQPKVEADNKVIIDEDENGDVVVAVSNVKPKKKRVR
jgi:hypothetical protein